MKSYLVRSPLLSVGLTAVFVLPAMTRAGQISSGDFSPSATIEDFESFGTGADLATPITVNGNTYDANQHLLSHSSKFGPAIGRAGVAIANRPPLAQNEVGFIDIALQTPYPKAGMYVWLGTPSAYAQFFDTGDNLLGEIALAGEKQLFFVGWRADVGRVGRIRAVDTGGLGGALTIDDLIVEIPEPTSLFNALIGAFIWRAISCRIRRLDIF